jgi:hypothetical protein
VEIISGKVLGKPESTEQKPPAEEPVRAPMRRIGFYYVDLKDTPIREALKVLLTSAEASYSVQEGVEGYVSGRLGSATVEGALDTLARSQRPGPAFTWKYEPMRLSGKRLTLAEGGEAGSYVISPPPVRGAKGREVTAPSSLARRVAGVLRGNDRQWQAILVSGDDPRTGTVSVVRISDVVKGGGANGKDHKVSRIDALGIVLEGADGTAPISVPLKRRIDAAPPATAP